MHFESADFIAFNSTFKAIPSRFLCLDKKVSVTTRFVILRLFLNYHVFQRKILFARWRSGAMDYLKTFLSKSGKVEISTVPSSSDSLSKTSNAILCSSATSSIKL